jgi:hypothetical protein
MATAKDYILDAYQLISDLGVDEALPDGLGRVGLKRANGILKEWSSKRQYSFELPEIKHTLEANKQIYTIGPGGDIDAERPESIECIRVDDTGTFPTSKIVGSIRYNEWQMISSKKSSASWPEGFYYNPAYPLGEIYLYPMPAIAYDMYIVQTRQFPTLEKITDEIILPQGMEELFTYSLCMKIAPYRGINVPLEVKQEYARLKSTVKANNRNLTPRMLLNTPFSKRRYNNRRPSFPWGDK